MENCNTCGHVLSQRELEADLCENCDNSPTHDFEPDEQDEIDFNPCDNCDLPDACEDFGCAIESGIRQESDWDW